MNDKHKLTEKLKVLETKIYDTKLDLKSINSKLEMAYKYEDELLIRQNNARLKTDELKKEFFAKSSVISKLYIDMKKIFDVWTGNFYEN